MWSVTVKVMYQHKILQNIKKKLQEALIYKYSDILQ